MAFTFSVSASAQYEYWIGGTADLGLGNTPGAKHSESEKVLMVGPSIGYVYSEVLEFGASAGFYHDRNMDSEFGTKYTELKVAPFVRYTFWENGDGWEKGELSFFIQGQLGLDYITSPFDVYNGNDHGFHTVERDLTTIGLGILPGIKYQITERLALVGTFGMIGFMSHSYKTNAPLNVQPERNGGIDVVLSDLGFTAGLENGNATLHTIEATGAVIGTYSTSKCSEFIANVGSGLSISLNYCF